MGSANEIKKVASESLKEWHVALHAKTLMSGFALFCLGIFIMFFLKDHLGFGLSLIIIGIIFISVAAYFRLMERSEEKIEEDAMEKFIFRSKITNAQKKKYLSLFKKELETLDKEDRKNFMMLFKIGLSVSAVILLICLLSVWL
ncbi:MAG: hypothetical protein KKE23_03670 [Nanoarchaeota archaeon]|nr:hypothetical protein [Nanoarchaeota archaeon]